MRENIDRWRGRKHECVQTAIVGGARVRESRSRRRDQTRAQARVRRNSHRRRGTSARKQISTEEAQVRTRTAVGNVSASAQKQRLSEAARVRENIDWWRGQKHECAETAIVGGARVRESISRRRELTGAQARCGGSGVSHAHDVHLRCGCTTQKRCETDEGFASVSLEKQASSCVEC